MDFPMPSIEDHVYTLWVHGYILLEKEGNYLELQDYARCWLLVYLHKRLLGKGFIDLFESVQNKKMGRKCRGKKTSWLICISSSREHFCVVRSTLNHPKDAGVLLSFPDLGLLPDVEVCSHLRECSVIHSSAAEALDKGIDQLTSKMLQTCIWKGNH